MLYKLKPQPCSFGSSVYRTLVLFFFFFQAEDGIRDLTVTGVQTCALPISDGQLGRVRRDGREELEGTQAHDRADVRPAVLRGVAGAGLAGVPPPRPPVADARAV